jgi:thiol-disulfide isomerase/thioredoxin
MTRFLIALAVASIAGVAPAAQSPAAPSLPTELPTTPAGCATAVRDYVAAGNRALGIGPDAAPPNTAAAAARIQQMKAPAQAFALRCVAQFNAAAVRENEIADLVALYDMGQTAINAETVATRNAAVDRVLASKDLPAAARLDMLKTLFAVTRMSYGTTTRDERRVGVYPLVERISDAVDAMPEATPALRLSFHQSALGRYRGDDIDSGIIKHATWILGAMKDLPVADRQKPVFMSPYVDMAEAWAGQGRTAEALELLRKGAAEFGGVPRAAEEFDPEIARLELVGRPAPAVVAPRWLNAPAGTAAMALDGHVTLLEFTAHWCGPCRESYPGVNRMRAELGPRGFQVVMATQLYGYFKTERGLDAATEISRDSAYFKEYSMDVPIAIGDQVHARIANGQLVYDPPGPDLNDTHYQVTGIPQIQIIDKHGVIRRILIGYDTANEPAIAAFVRTLLDEH